MFGEGGIFGPDLPEDSAGGGIGVNNLLWRASLDTVSFMPLVSADPFGGVIITDWYTPPSAPDERFKVNIYILGRALRADGIRASVFRQQMQGAGWVDAPVALNTATDLENAILTRARQMRLSGLGIAAFQELAAPAGLPAARQLLCCRPIVPSKPEQARA